MRKKGANGTYFALQVGDSLYAGENMKELLTGKVPLFLTQEKALKKIYQERARGDLSRARRTAVEALEKWPDDYDLAVEAAQACLDLSDYPQATNLLKNAHKRHASRRDEIMEIARAAFMQSFSTLLGSFIVETFLKARNIEALSDILRASPESFAVDLTKRGETRSKNLAAEGQDKMAFFAENELLLGILYKQGQHYAKSIESLGRALEMLPADAHAIGGLLVELEQELPADAFVKYCLGLASLLLAHPDKAEIRFFQALELEAPPLDKILRALETAKEQCPNGDLLRGEILVRSGRTADGATLMRSRLFADPAASGPDGASAREERLGLAERRLAKLPSAAFGSPEISFLYCDVASALGLAKEAIDVLERVAGDAGSTDTIIDWLEKNETAALTAPGQNLLARGYLGRGSVVEGIGAVRRAVELNATLVPGLIDLVRTAVEASPDCDPRLKALLAELYARSDDRTSAEEVFGSLKRTRALDDAALVALSAEIMKHSGIFLTGVISALEISLGAGRGIEAYPHILALYRDKPEEHADLASSMQELAAEHEDRWKTIAEIVERLAKESELSGPFRLLLATAHFFTGGVERAIFEFDQILMRDGNLKYRIIEIYKKGLARFDANATLHLALYHLYLEEELFADAARHLCRTLELDPSQIRDVVAQFGKLVDREPGNLAIWEEMLKTALAMNRTSLASEVLGRAIAALPAEKAAALHVYGARISAADGKWDDALKCIALTLTSPEADVRTLEGEIRGIISRDPANPRAQILFGETLLRLGKDAEAVAAIKRCIDIAPAMRKQAAEVLERFLPLGIEPWLISAILGEISWLEGRQDDAFGHFTSAQKGPREALPALSASIERIRAASPENERLETLYARNLSLEGRHAEAVSILERLIAKNAGFTRTATDMLFAIVKERPEQCEANRLLARIFVASGDVEQSRQAVVRILSDETADPARIDAVVAEFLALHEQDGEFLMGYASLKARGEETEEALARYGQALRRDPSRAEAVLAGLERQMWPPELRDTERLLRVDCLMAARRDGEAFALLGSFSSRDGTVVDELVSRLATLIERGPRRQHFSLGASLLAGAGRVEAAEELVTRGRSVLGPEDALDLAIELAEIHYNAGDVERAERLFSEALESAPEKSRVLKRIERSSAQWTDREIGILAARLEEGTAREEDIARLVRLVLERTGAAEAIEILSRGAVSRDLRSDLLGAIYLSMDRPALACAALGAAGGAGRSSDTERYDHLYLAGVARERTGDHGMAASLFAGIAGERADFRDSRDRALKNYTRFIESHCEERVLVLEKSEAL
jgi:tetratricopeptide (TPR) repeat protein